MRPYKWIWQYISKYKLPLGFSLCLSLASTALGLVPPYISGRIVDEVFQKNNRDIMLSLLLVMVVATILKSIVKYSFQIIFESTSQNIVRNLRKDLYRRVQVQSFNFFDTNRVGDIMARMTGDLEAIRHFIAFTIYSLLENILTFIIAITLMFFINWQLTLILLTVAPAILFLVRRQSAAVRPMFVNVREQFSKLNSVCQENISGNRVVKAFTKEDYEIQKFTNENQAYYDANFNTAKTWIKFMPLTDFLAGFLSVILLFAGGIFVALGKLELWQMVTINGYLWAVSNPMRMVGWLVNDVQRFAASLDKIFSMMRQKIRIENPKNPVAKEKIKGKIEFKNVSFGYDQFNKDALVLKNISFTAEKGHTIGIVGSTGSGKTTLISLISRYYDVLDGEVLVDGINVRDYDLQSLRRGITASSQDIFLFSDTIEGNIAYGVPEAPMEKVTSSAEVASASSFINELYEGYDTIIGERGVGLSGGQRQRLSLARAIATDPSVLILDDTTSAVDMETEHEIQKALKAKYGSITKFIIAHRISSVRTANLILVLENGEIIERGTHEELVSMKGHYYSLFISQYGEYAKEGGEHGKK